MSDQKRNDLLKQMQDMEDGTGGGSGVTFTEVGKAGSFVVRGGGEVQDIGASFEGVILLIQKSLVLFPKFDENAPADTPNKPILSTSPVISYDDLAEDRMSKEVRTFGEWKNMYGDQESGKKATTQMQLTILPIKVETNDAPGLNKASDFVPMLLRCGGFSINPQNENGLFDYTKKAAETHKHVSMCVTKFGVGSFTTDDGRKVFYTAFSDSGPIAENHLAVVAEEKKKAVDAKIKQQKKLEKLRHHDDTQTHPPVSDADAQPSIPF